MKFQRTYLKDIVICEPIRHHDERGCFSEVFRKDLLENFLGHNINFVQENESINKRGVVRGLHYQTFPYSQSKLTRVVKGTILDIAVDIRIGSPTFGKFVAIELSESNMRQLYIPRGFAHGFIALEDNTQIVYKVDNYYNQECEKGIVYDDRTIGIDWKLPQHELILSKRDTLHPKLSEAENLFEYGINYYAQ